MKRYVCTVAAGLVLALMGTATASANGLPVPGQEATQAATQVTSFGDQSVGEQKNDADVTQSQGNGNLNLSPAIGIGGDATTTNEQGNGNVAKSDIDQENEVEQSQDATQKLELDQNGSSGDCCTDQSQSGEQKTYGGDQSVEEQKNDADVTQKQGNGNVNIAPAIAVFGDAETTNEQGNGNVAKSDIDQENEVEQSQDSTQKQHLGQDGGSCCESSDGYGKYENDTECGCTDGPSQTGDSTGRSVMPVQPADASRSTRRITARELEVLALIADGYSTREIAQRLWITDETVRTHVRRLLSRLGARTRAHAVATAYRDGLWSRNGEAG